MKELLGTLHFYVTDENMGMSSAEKQTGPKEYEICIRPIADKTFAEMLEMPININTLETIISHELGHFVASISQDVSHNPMYRMTFGPYDGEKRAWELAHEIKPDLNPLIERKALGSYQKGRKEYHKITGD
jgi:hypothetical protein